jgi:hypothetical protein
MGESASATTRSSKGLPPLFHEVSGSLVKGAPMRFFLACGAGGDQVAVSPCSLSTVQ